MRFERIHFMPGEEGVYYDAYVADPTPGFVRPALLVIPGGGYGGVCSDREGEPIALAFLARGFNAFVLHYTVGRKKVFPAQLVEASLAAAHIRHGAGEYGIDPGQLFAVGFSAGGHLAGSLGILWDHPAAAEALAEAGATPGENRPDGIMLVYPVVTGIGEIANSGTIRNLWATDNPTEEQCRAVSLELHVTGESSPAFLVHTSNDGMVDVRNSLVLAEAYRCAGVLFEMHIYPDAPHGVALGNEITAFGRAEWNDPAIAGWVGHAAEWAKRVKK